MKFFRASLIMLIGLVPLSVSAAIVAVEFAAESFDSFDEMGQPSVIEGIFYVDTSTPESAAVGNYPGAVFGMETFRDGTPLLAQDDFITTCPPANSDQCANDAFVSATGEADINVQDFFVGNLSLDLQAASGVNFNNDIDIFLLAAQGNVADYFNVFASIGSIQAIDDESFALFFLDMTEVSQVPLPAAAWLFISALGGLVVAKRKQQKA